MRCAARRGRGAPSQNRDRTHYVQRHAANFLALQNVTQRRVNAGKSPLGYNASKDVNILTGIAQLVPEAGSHIEYGKWFFFESKFGSSA